MSQRVKERLSRIGWTLPQRKALSLILCGFGVFLVIRRASNPTFISDPQPDAAARSAELADRIDPNTATWQDLAALPNLGEKRARAIIAYRDARNLAPGTIVFRSADDLMLVRGIGVSMAAKLNPYLLFTPSTTTRP